MAQKGRPAMPVRQQVLEGNPNNKTRAEIVARAKAEATFDVISSENINPPKWLDKRGAQIFKDLVKVLKPVGILNEADTMLVADYAHTQVLYVEVAMILNSEGLKDLETGKPSGFLKELNTLSGRLRTLGDKMGLSPQARASIANTVAGLTKLGKDEDENGWDKD